MEKKHLKKRPRREKWSVADYAYMVPAVFEEVLAEEMKYRWRFSTLAHPTYEAEYHLTMFIDDADDAWFFSPFVLKAC